MKNLQWEVLKQFPPSSINSSREIIKNAIEKFKKSPSMYWANRLGEYGIEVDFNNYDAVFVTESDFNK